MTKKGTERQGKELLEEIRFSLSLDERCDERKFRKAIAEVSATHPSLRLLNYEHGTAKCVASVADLEKGFSAYVTLDLNGRRDRSGKTVQEQYLTVRPGMSIPRPLRPYVSSMTFDVDHITYDLESRI